MVDLAEKKRERDYPTNRPLPWRRLPCAYRFFIVILALFYGIVLATRPLLEFKDRLNYLNYFSVSDNLIERRLAGGVMSFLSNEPVWLLLARSAGEYFGPEVALRMLVGIPAAIVAFVALRFGPKDVFWIVLFLLIPLVIKNHVIHLRQGLAVAVFLFAYFLIRRTKLRILIICLCPFIHSSFFFIVILLLVSRLLRSPRVNFAFSFVIVLAACIVLAVSLPTLLTLSEARQALSLGVQSGGLSGLGFLFWIGILFLIFISGADSIRSAAFPFTLLIFYSATYFIFSYSGRVLESGVLVVLISLLNLPTSQRRMSLLAVLVFFVVTWAPRLGSPGFGWGL
ncbi:EpsG family protein [Corynebacterium comes]|uniref:Glycosyltransferase RgtA/B/C/D-like domain-containing protein n=1 Tax=Corynebacterium comes TaxID=2675218 RepID=A0A6B8W180_9CORY|nr:EpsG family protein [Corynebacterium comes]QGU05145.1 hypothetical protein CETAM_09480 [Corynebacterium comes]